jgi:hypothetical protein
MQPGPIRQSYVNPRAGVVEPSPGCRGKPLGEPTYGVLVREGRGHGSQPVAAVDEDLPVPVDQHVGEQRIGEQGFERAHAARLSAQRVDNVENGTVAEHSPIGSQRISDVGWCRLYATVGEHLPNPDQQRWVSTTRGKRSQR